MIAIKLAGAAAVLGLTLASSNSSAAEARYDPGASDTEIRVGQTMPYSGPASAYAVVGQVEAAYFRMINERGGVNGRKLNLLSYDDGYNPSRTVEQIRKLVESDEVLLTFQTLGIPPNAAIQKYLNDRRVPQLFVSARAMRFEDPRTYPWTMGFAPSVWTEARVYARFILDNYPNARIGVLYENNDGGKDLLAGLKAGLGNNASAMVVAARSYEITDPTVDSQLVALRAAGADLLLDGASAKFASQAIRKTAEMNWKPLHILGVSSASIGQVLAPAGLGNARGIISASSFKEATDPAWGDDDGMKRWGAFMDRYDPGGDRKSVFTTYGYSAAQLLVRVLERCGNDLSRTNVMRQATTLDHVGLDLLLPGISVNTSPQDYRVLKQFRTMRFTGERWEFFGPVIADEAAGQ